MHPLSATRPVPTNPALHVQTTLSIVPKHSPVVVALRWHTLHNEQIEVVEFRSPKKPVLQAHEPREKAPGEELLYAGHDTQDKPD